MPLARSFRTSALLAGLLLSAAPVFAQPMPLPGPGTTPAPAGARPGVAPSPATDEAAPQLPVRVPGRESVAGTVAMTGRAFTYQGLLRASGTPLSGPCDLAFTIWDAVSGGTALSPTQFLTSNLSDGLFTVTLNDAAQFPDSVFDGRAVWVEIAVRSPSGSGAFTTLAPRQPLTAVPVASTLTPHALIRAGDTYNGSPAVMVDARPDVWGNPEALRVQAVPSNRWFSFAPTALWADSDTGNGVVGVTRAGTGVFGGGAEPASWAGYFWGNVKVTGKLEVDRFRSWIAINSTGPLPLSSAAFTSSGGTLRLQYSGSGYSATPSTLIGMTVKLDGSAIDQTGIFANQSGMHLAFVSKEWVLTGIPAGSHTVTLEPMAGTFTDGGDIFNVTITEMPY